MPFPFIVKYETDHILTPIETLCLRAWHELDSGRQGGGMGIGRIARSEMVGYLWDEWGIGRGPYRERVIRLIYGMDGEYRAAASKTDGD